MNDAIRPLPFEWWHNHDRPLVSFLAPPVSLNPKAIMMMGLRSRKDASPKVGGDDNGTGFANGKLRFKGSSLSSSHRSGNPIALGVLAFLAFVLVLVLTAPPKHERYAGMEMLRSEHRSMFKEGHAKQVEKVGKTGKVLHKPITSVKREDLKGLVDNLPENLDSITYEEAIQGRERLVEILTDAGVEELDVPTVLSLPKWSQVTKLYGDGPVVIGLETCQRFRETIPLDDASIGTAGTTTYLMLLRLVCFRWARLTMSAYCFSSFGAFFFY